MIDIVPEVLASVKESFKNEVASNKSILEFMEKAHSGNAMLIDAHEYSGHIGRALGKAFKDNIKLETMPNGKLYWNVASRVVDPMIRQNHELVMSAGEYAAVHENTIHGIKLGAVRSKINEERVHGLIETFCEEEITEEQLAERLMYGTENITEAFFDEFVKSNAEFQYQCGYDPLVVRTVARDCCEWCRAKAGTFEYADVMARGNDVWQRHKYCQCSVVYTHKGVVTLVHSPSTSRAKNKVRR